jgi:hypothetical protein
MKSRLVPLSLLNMWSSACKGRLPQGACNAPSQDRCAVPRPLRCPKTAALSQDRCAVPSPLRCPKTAALSQVRCAVPRPLRCPKTAALSQDRCAVPRPLRCPKTAALSQDRCAVPRPLRCSREPPCIYPTGSPNDAVYSANELIKTRTTKTPSIF